MLFRSWVFSDPDVGQSEYAYQIIFDDDVNPSDPLFNSGKCLGQNNPISKCKIAVSDSSYFFISPSDIPTLNYDTKYYWWVTVWDDNDVASEQKQYNTIPDTDNDDGVVLTFTTYKHKMPIASFTHFPDQPSKGEQVKFTNTSKIYLSADPDTAVNCTIGLCEYEWSATAGATINDTATTSPIITFNSAGNPTVTLKVTDNDDYYTSTSTKININSQLPKWKEIKPE